jgi:Golgi nucleoside diphosphatase
MEHKRVWVRVEVSYPDNTLTRLRVSRVADMSAYAGWPDEAARSLDSQLDVAMRTVPKALCRCTPVAVKAKAGLRFLGASRSTEYPFPLASQDPIVIMDGRDEYVFVWVMANYFIVMNVVMSPGSE